MRQNKKIVSLVVVLAMIMTMLSSFIVVNAADGVVKTEAVETETGVTLKISYADLDIVDKQLGNVTFKVAIPNGFTAKSIVLSDNFVGATENVKSGVANTDRVINITKFDSTGDGFVLPATSEVATVELELTTVPTETTPYEFTVSGVEIGDLDLNTITLGNGATAVNGTYTKEVEPVIEGPVAYIENANIVDGTVDIKIGYKDFTDLDSKKIGNATFKVDLPEGFEATAIVLSETFNGATENVKSGVANTDRVINITKFDSTGDGFDLPNAAEVATVTLKAPADVTGVIRIKVTAVEIGDLDLNTITLGNGISASTAKLTVGGSEPTPPTTEGEVTAVKLDKTEFTAKAGATVTITATVEGTTENKDVTATATNGATVTVDGNVVKVTVPDTAKTGDEITVTVAADADATKTATAKITVNNPAYEIKGADETFKVNGKTNKMFKPAITVDDAEKFAAAFNDTESYRIVFDFRTAKNANAGYGLFVVTGAQLKAIAGGADAGIYSTVSGAASAELHIETTSGDIK